VLLLGLLFVGVVVAVALAPRLFPFLALTKPVGGDVLVVEGWLNSYMIPEAADVYRRGTYAVVVITGLQKQGNGTATEEPAAPPSTARSLVLAGVPPEVIVLVPAKLVGLHKTFASAQAFRSWLNGHPEYRGVDVFTVGGHARKTYVVYRRVLGPQATVGIIAGKVQKLDVQHWWRTRRTIYIVAKGIVGWLYAVVWPYR
jgi:hypothetical protein